MPHLKTTETVVARSAIDKDILRDEGVHPEVEGYGKVVLVRIVRVEKYADGDVGRRLETV